MGAPGRCPACGASTPDGTSGRTRRPPPATARPRRQRPGTGHHVGLALPDLEGDHPDAVGLRPFPDVAAEPLLSPIGSNNAGDTIGLPRVVDAYASMGRAVRVPRPECRSCLSPVVFWSGYWRHVRWRRRERKIFIPRVRGCGCGVTHALLPAFVLARRLDAAESVGAVIGQVAGRGVRGPSGGGRGGGAGPAP